MKSAKAGRQRTAVSQCAVMENWEERILLYQDRVERCEAAIRRGEREISIFDAAADSLPDATDLESVG